MSIKVDVAIIGAGLVGLTLANVLNKHGLQVAIIDSGSIEPIHIDGNQLRVSALNLASKNLFDRIDVWNKVKETQRLSAFENMFVWDSVGRGEISFEATMLALPCLGYILENAVLHNQLLAELQSANNIFLYENQKPQALRLLNDIIEVSLKPFSSQEHTSLKNTVQASLVVGADGAHSWVRDYAGLATYTWSYHHHALVTTVNTERTHAKTAWQCFLPEGPLALLPLSDAHTCSIVWSAPFEKINYLRNLNDAQFNAEITQAYEHRLGQIKKINKLFSVPLHMRHAKEYIQTRVALIGDAAHTIHPLAGQGVNLGFADAAILAEYIVKAKQAGEDIGSSHHLRSYNRERKSDNWLMILGMECFKRVFQGDFIVNTKARSLGLTMVNQLPWVKNQFIQQALGL